jgi:hypothetical protein
VKLPFSLLLIVLVGALLRSSASAQSYSVQPAQSYQPQPNPAAIHDPRPPSGIGGIVVGSAALGVAGLNLVTMPICFASFYPAGADDDCAVLSGVFAAIGVAVGLPSLIVGRRRRARYKEWRARQRPYAELLRGLRVDVAEGRAGLALSATF